MQWSARSLAIDALDRPGEMTVTRAIPSDEGDTLLESTSGSRLRRPLPHAEYHFAATDGWVHLPGRAEPHFTIGLVAMHSGQTQDVASRLRGRAPTPAPPLSVVQGQVVNISIHDIGLHNRPDLDSGHVLRWSGIEGACIVEDALERTGTTRGHVISRSLRFDHPGAHVYGVEFEDPDGARLVAHGLVIVHPSTAPEGALEDIDRDATTRGFAFLLGELRAGAYDPRLSRQDLGSIDAPPDHFTVNGRSYPDTVRPSSDPSLPYQPMTSLVRLSEGETFRLVAANTCDEVREMALSGLPMQVVNDGTRPGSRSVYTSEAMSIRPGAVSTALISAPPFEPAEGISWDRIGPFNRYLFAGTDPRVLVNGDPRTSTALGGLATEVRVYPADRSGGRSPHPRRRRGQDAPRPGSHGSGRVLVPATDPGVPGA
jgi:hypothetical protein